MIFHCSAHNIFFLLDKSWLLNWQKRHLGRFVNGYPLVLHASAKTSQQVQENNHTTWKVDGATSMYWFSMAPYQATFWEFCHLLSLRCTSPFELLNTLADFFRGCFCYTTLPAKKKTRISVFSQGSNLRDRAKCGIQVSVGNGAFFLDMLEDLPTPRAVNSNSPRYQES